MNRSAVPFAIIAAVSIVAAGFISAITAFSPSYMASWMVAYLVLVVGVAQLMLGFGQAYLAEKAPSRSLLIAEIVLFNVANIATIAGTLMSMLVVVYFGAALMIVSLGLFLWGVRMANRKHLWLLYGFRSIILILLISAPIGLVIATFKK